jgi:MFS family permease
VHPSNPSVSSAAEATAADEAAVPISPGRRRVAIGVGGAAVLLASLDAYVVVTLIGAITADLHIGLNDFQQATPIITWFLLGYVAGMPLLGGLSDRLGRRLVIELCLVGFLVGSAVTAGSIHISGWLQDESYAMPILVAGRALQGVAGGALLPVTMALVADLWAERRRPVILGTVGAAQELGSVLGPLYGAGLAAVSIGGTVLDWEGVFWVNVPLSLLAIVAVHFALPGKAAFQHSGSRFKIDVVGGLLLAVALGLLTLGLNNQDPETSVLPPNGPLFISLGAGALLLFILWEWFAKTKLIDLSSARKGPFFAVLGASFLAGAALLVTLFDISLFAYGVVGDDDVTEAEAAALLVKFLVALPIGAVLGGFLAPRVGMRTVTVGGFLVAASAYWLISTWPMTILEEHYHLPGIALPRLDTDLAVAGLGLGLVIAPLSAAVLHLVPADQHGVASAGVVVARTMGMLIGFSALTAWGLYRFNVLMTEVWDPPPFPWGQEELEAYSQATKVALLHEYHEIFSATSILCLLAAVISLAVVTRRAEAEIEADRTHAAV